MKTIAQRGTHRAWNRLIRRLQTSECTLPAAELAVQEFLGAGDDLDLDVFQPLPDRYARYFLHRHPQFSVVVIAWDRGQESPIHNHDGLWVVDVLLSGELEIVEYAPPDKMANGRVRLLPSRLIHAVRGQVMTLEPPRELHRVRALTPAVTLNIFGGELRRCMQYVPLGGGTYGPEAVPLPYDAAVVL